jgi:hypothetical protein
MYLLFVANTKATLAAAVTLLGLTTTFTPAGAAVTKLATLASLASLSAAKTILRYLERRAVTLDWDAGDVGCLYGHRVGNDGRVLVLGVLLVLVPLASSNRLGRLGLLSRL